MLLFHLSIVEAETSEPERFCRSDGKKASPWLKASRMIQLQEDVASVSGLIEQLRRKHGIPISWIAVRPVEPLRLEVESAQLDDLLRTISEQHPGYRCEVRAGRLVLRSGDEVFDRVIEGVNLADRYRFVALVDYIEHLQAIGGGFESWDRPIVGGILETPLFEEKVTLAPRAPLMDHLIQLLGKRLNTFFTIPAPGESPRTIWISEAF